EDTIKGVQRSELDIIFCFTSRGGEDIVEHEWRGDNRRPAIKLETVLLEDVSAAAGFVEFFKDLYLVASRRQARRRAEAPKPAADDDYLLCHDFSCSPQI